MSLIRFSVARNRRFLSLSYRKFETSKSTKTGTAESETAENETAHPESKYGTGETKFKVDWSDKQQRWVHAAINSNPVIKPYHQKKEPFAAWEINEREDKELRPVKKLIIYESQLCRNSALVSTYVLKLQKVVIRPINSKMWL